MSRAQHEQAADSHDSQAAPHDLAYDPNAMQSKERCSGHAAYTASADTCWSSVTNPTAEHKADAEKHRKMAADHRAAAGALRGAETQACAGLNDSDRDTSPFDHREDITKVIPATEALPAGYTSQNQRTRMVGATVSFRAVPGMTAEWLQRIVDCHIARNNAVGNSMPEMSYCPLVPKGVSATVTSAGGGFSVTIKSDDPATAQEVLRRAQALKG